MRNPGRLIRCESGKGIILNSDKPIINGKYLISIIDDEFDPVIGEDGKQIKVMVAPENIKVIGYVD